MRWDLFIFFIEETSGFSSFSCHFLFRAVKWSSSPPASVIFLKQVIPDWKQVESSHPICRMFHFLCRAGCRSGVELPASRTEQTLVRAVPTGPWQSKRRQNGEQEMEEIRWREEEWREKETASEIERGSERGLNGFQTGCTAEWSWWVKECEMWLWRAGICFWDFFIRLLSVCASINHKTWSHYGNKKQAKCSL